MPSTRFKKVGTAAAEDWESCIKYYVRNIIKRFKESRLICAPKGQGQKPTWNGHALKTRNQDFTT